MGVAAAGELGPDSRRGQLAGAWGWLGLPWLGRLWQWPLGRTKDWKC